MKLDSVTVRTCTGCKKQLSNEFFHKSNKRKNPRCKECFNAQVAARYARLRSSGLCFDCNNPSATPVCSTCKKIRNQVYWDRYRERQLVYGKERRKKLKLSAFNAYGGAECKCCGERTVEFLSIDHIDGNGSEHRRKIASGENGSPKSQAVKFYEWLRANSYPPGFQVLCMNCNFAKGHFGKCPHQLKREASTND
jgi:hypothetical protein